MMRSLLRLACVAALGLSASSCVHDPMPAEVQPVNYDVREAAVLAGPDVSLALIREVDSRVSDAIASTQRTVMLPRVVLTVTIDKVRNGVGESRDGNEATFTVNATSVDSGEVVASGNFKVFSPTLNKQTADFNLAEEIAARIRFAFGLTRPSVNKMRQPMPPMVQAVPDPSVSPAVTGAAPCGATTGGVVCPPPAQ